MVNKDDENYVYYLVSANIKKQRKKHNLTQEQFANKTKFKMAYISTIENGDANLTCKNIDSIALALDIKTNQLFDEKTAQLAKKLPKRVDMYKKHN